MTSVNADTPRPLNPTRQLPPTPSSAVISLKRSFGSTNTPSGTVTTKKRAIAMPLTPSATSRLAVLPDSTTTTTVSSFKVPAIPARSRLLTPSTSTVACSSSPPRLSSPLPSSSPPRAIPATPSKSLKSKLGKADCKTVYADLKAGETMILGRHRHNGTSSTTSSTNTAQVPVALAHLLLQPRLSETKTMHLPRSASHASRVHAAVEYLAVDDLVRVVVLGQNGLRVKSHGMKKRFLQGQRIDLRRDKGDVVELDFYGCTAKITFPSLPAKEESGSVPARQLEADLEEELFTPPPQVASDLPSSPFMDLPRSSLPPSSPPVEHQHDMDIDSELGLNLTLDSAHAEAEEREVSRRTSSPLSAISDDGISVKRELVLASEDGPDEEEGGDDVRHGALGNSTAEIITNTKPLSRQSSPAPLKQVIIPPLPDSVDLPAILASTVVFSGSSKLSLPDLVKHMLEAQPSLKQLGEESTWDAWVGRELEGNAMFGKVSRSGKDASGRPLLPHYFYNPSADPDRSRAKELGGLVRPLRTVQREGGKAIDWRPVGSGRRKYY